MPTTVDHAQTSSTSYELLWGLHTLEVVPSSDSDAFLHLSFWAFCRDRGTNHCVAPNVRVTFLDEPGAPCIPLLPNADCRGIGCKHIEAPRVCGFKYVLPAIKGSKEFELTFRIDEQQIGSVRRTVQTADGGLQPTGMKDRVVNVRFLTDFAICNFKCPYCIVVEQQEKAGYTHWPGEDNYLRIIANLLKLPFDINVRIGVPGEFFINKVLVDGARQLSQAEQVRSVNLITNLSTSPEAYSRHFEGFERGKVAVVASYHPTEIKDKDRWLATARWIDARFSFAIVLVAWPPLLDILQTTVDELKGVGFTVFVQAFRGTYDDKDYPKSYTKEERELMRPTFYSRHDWEHLVELKNPGMCSAGMSSFTVDMKGVVRPCVATNAILGNLLEKDGVKLFTGARPCPAKTCLCDTENINTVEFSQFYVRDELNQHKYVYKYQEAAKLFPEMDEWKIAY